MTEQTSYLVRPTLPNHGRTKGPTKRRVLSIPSHNHSPQLACIAAVHAAKYTVHLPPTENVRFHNLMHHHPPGEAIWLPPRPLIDDRRRI